MRILGSQFLTQIHTFKKVLFNFLKSNLRFYKQTLKKYQVSIEYHTSTKLTIEQIQILETSILNNRNYNLLETSLQNKFQSENLKFRFNDNHGSFYVEIVQTENGLIVSFRIATKKDRETFLNLVITSLKQKGIHCIFEEI